MSTASSYNGNVPENYERYLGPVLFEPYAVDMAARVPENALSLLELACGTGRVTHHLDRILPQRGTLIATDLNADMISVARTIVFSPRVQWMEANAQHLPFANASFDVVVCQFGVMFFSDKEAAFREVWRVLRSGGTFLFNTWDSLAHNPRAAVILDVLQEELGERAPDFFSVGPYSFHNEMKIAMLLEAAGFDAVRMEKLALNSTMAGPSEIVAGFVDGSPLGLYLDKLGPEWRQRIGTRLLAALEKQLDTYGNQVPMQAIVVTAQR